MTGRKGDAWQRLAHYDKPASTQPLPQVPDGGPRHRAPVGLIDRAWDRLSWWMHHHRALVGTAAAGVAAIALIAAIAIVRSPAPGAARPPVSEPTVEVEPLPPLARPTPRAVAPERRRTTRPPSRSPSPAPTRTRTVTPSPAPAAPPVTFQPPASDPPPAPTPSGGDTSPSPSPTSTETLASRNGDHRG